MILVSSEARYVIAPNSVSAPTGTVTQVSWTNDDPNNISVTIPFNVDA